MNYFNGVPCNDIKKVFRKWSLRLHPNKTMSTNGVPFIALGAAYERAQARCGVARGPFVHDEYKKPRKPKSPPKKPKSPNKPFRYENHPNTPFLFKPFKRPTKKKPNTPKAKPTIFKPRASPGSTFRGHPSKPKGRYGLFGIDRHEVFPGSYGLFGSNRKNLWTN